MYEFHVSRLSRERYDFDQSIFRFDGNAIFTNFLAARQFTQKINQKRDLINYPESAISAGDINAAGLIDEILHLVVSLYRRQVDPTIIMDIYNILEKSIGVEDLKSTLIAFIEEFPPIAVYRTQITPDAYLAGETDGTPNKLIALEEMMMLWITNRNPAVSHFADLFDDTILMKITSYRQVMQQVKKIFQSKPHFGPDNQDLYTMLRSPAIEEPYSLAKQLEYIRRKWGALLGDYLFRLLNSLDLIREETKAVFVGPGPTRILSFQQL